jgi:hypothetical protein
MASARYADCYQGFNGNLADFAVWRSIAQAGILARASDPLTQRVTRQEEPWMKLRQLHHMYETDGIKTADELEAGLPRKSQALCTKQRHN